VTSWILCRRDYDLSRLALPVVDLFLRGLAAPGAVKRARTALVAVAPSGGR
jgi:hypothetical protein